MKQGPIPMTCMARNSDEIGAQVPASTGDHTKMFFSRQKKTLFMIKKSCIFLTTFLTTLHVFKKYACEKKCSRVTLSW